jgi:hypothetical protein
MVSNSKRLDARLHRRRDHDLLQTQRRWGRSKDGPSFLLLDSDGVVGVTDPDVALDRIATLFNRTQYDGLFPVEEAFERIDDRGGLDEALRGEFVLRRRLSQFIPDHSLFHFESHESQCGEIYTRFWNRDGTASKRWPGNLARFVSV